MAEFLPHQQPPVSFEAFHNYSSPPIDDYNTYQHQLPQQQLQQQQQQQQLAATINPTDFFAFEEPSAILVPNLEQFDTELDHTLEEFGDQPLQLVSVDSSDPYQFLRSDTPSAQQYRQPGPGSTFSESFSNYESLSSYSESNYYSQSEYLPNHRQLGTDFVSPNYPLPTDLMELKRIRIEAPSAYPTQRTSPPLDVASLVHPMQGSRARSSYGAMPPSPPQQQQVSGDHYRQRSTSSGYEYGQPIRASKSEYGGYMRHPSLAGMQPGRQGYVGRNGSPPSVSPSSTTSSTDASGLSMPVTPPMSSHRGEPRLHDEPVNEDDPRRKYKCPNCPRSFARAFNLKTHMATHDPNRPKPHVCPHKACSRSFSRKHDLGRHLVSIHRDEHGMAHASQGIAAGSPAPSVSGSTRSERGIGVDKAARGWCDTCGKGWVGHQRACNCHDVK